MVQMLDHFIPKGRTHVIEKTEKDKQCLCQDLVLNFLRNSDS